MPFLDLDELTEEERALQEGTRKFAKEVLRPASVALDRMSPEERVRQGSPYHEVMAKMKRLGYHRLYLPPEEGGQELSPLARYLVQEEIGWGSLGFATAIGVDMIPFMITALFGSSELKEEILVPWAEDTEGRFHGCWGVTEPDHGSDYLMIIRGEEIERIGRGNVIARQDGDSWVISGQKSAWVSSAPTATHCGLHVQVEGTKTLAHGMFVVIPLDAEGVRKGKPADMLGMRDDPQGELFFDEVRIPEHYVVVANTPFYTVFADQLLCLTSCGMGAFAVGLARAAFEEALAYARERVQGGVPIIHHKNVKLKLYEMFEKIETARSYVRKAMAYTHKRTLEDQTFDASPRHARAAQIYAKKVAYAVANDALQVFGAYGLSKEYVIEKLFRDARAMQIEDGTIEVLSLEASDDVVQNYEKEQYAAEALEERWQRFA